MSRIPVANKDQRFPAMLTADERESLERAAKAEEMSMNEILRAALRAWLKRKKYWR